MMNENSSIMRRNEPGQDPSFLFAKSLLRPLVNLFQEALEDFAFKRDCVTRTAMQGRNRRGVGL